MCKTAQEQTEHSPKKTLDHLYLQSDDHDQLLQEDFGQNFTQYDFQNGCPAPSMDRWMKDAKASPNAAKIGMYLTHNGVVRADSRAKVREGVKEAPDVTGMSFNYDEQLVKQAIADTYLLPGIYYIKVWLNQGDLHVGDDLMYVMVGGDIRPHVITALEYLVGRLKSECVTEVENVSDGDGS